MHEDYMDQVLSLEEAVKLPYYTKLIEIKEVFQYLFVDFPFEPPCNIAAKIVHLTTGLSERGGLAVDSFDQTIISGNEWHAWNYDPERNLNICLVLPKYDQRLLSPVIMKEPSYLLEVDLFYTNLQRQLTSAFLNLEDIFHLINLE
jgi:hypothetical protein